jgi:hypothetical protein
VAPGEVGEVECCVASSSKVGVPLGDAWGGMVCAERPDCEVVGRAADSLGVHAVIWPVVADVADPMPDGYVMGRSKGAGGLTGVAPAVWFRGA